MNQTETRRRAARDAAPVGAEAAPARDRRMWLVAIPLVLLVAAAFGPALDNGFVAWDDRENLLANYHYRGLGRAQVRWAWTTFHLGVYQPLAWMLYEVQYAVWGLDPRGYHLTSLLLHAADAVALYALIVALLVRCRPDPFLRRPWARAVGAGLATALFAVHPLRVEPVAWASAQSYLPCALSSMLAVLAYLRAVGDSDPPRRAWLGASFALFAAAMLFKAPAVGLPAVLLILDVYPLRRLGGGPGRWLGPSARRVWLEKVPFLALGLVFMGLAVAAKTANRTIRPLGQDGVAGRVAQACYAAWFYLVKTAIPRDITAFYPRNGPIDWHAPPFLASILATAALSAGLFLLRRRWPGLLAAWLGYLVLLAPTSNLVRVGDQMAADRYSYLPMLALAAPAAAGLGLALASSRRSRARPAAVGAVALAVAAALGLIPLTRDQCRIWRTPKVLWTHALEHGGRSATAHLNLGLVLSLGGDFAAAARHFIEAIRLDPGDPRPYLNLGVVLLHQGDLAEAERHYTEGIRFYPGSPEPHINLGAILAGRGDYAAAAAHYAEALRLDPDHIQARINLARILAACPDARYRDGHRAVACATRACELGGWEEPDALDALAAAYAEGGDFDAAIRWQARAIAMLADGPTRDEYRSRLALYRAGKPYRETAPGRLPTGPGP